MKWAVEITGPARRDLSRLNPQDARRITSAIERYAEAQLGDVKRLRGAEVEYRLRVGPWRVRFEHDHERGLMRILRVLPRDRAYRD